LSPGGVCADLLEHCVRHHVVISSRSLLDELGDVLTRKFHQRAVDARGAIRLLGETFTLVTPDALESPVCRDRDDDVVLAPAMAERCTAIVSGDQDLLVGSFLRHPSAGAGSVPEMGISVRPSLTP